MENNAISGRFPDLLLGIWKMSAAESVFPGIDPVARNAAQIRVYSHAGNGKLMCHFTGARADGSAYHGHWTSSLDGTAGPEYTSINGPEIHYMVIFSMISDHEFAISNTAEGRPELSGQLFLSEDGEMLTYRYRLASHFEDAENIAIYRRWVPE